ncbi:hypothetical protein C8J56DRAFT_1091733 [Mycena floridula]|nr:hypothetical protein C8J56DRAFT_1091733 [Mycena floridula]
MVARRRYTYGHGFSDAKYEFNQVTPGSEKWAVLKPEQKFNQMSRLSVKKADGTFSYHIWETTAIELYLAEKLGLIPGDLLERTNSVGVFSSLRGLQDPVLRAAKHEKSIVETISDTLKAHEDILEKSRGTYYEGDKVSVDYTFGL